MDIKIIYFSPTGGTLRIASRIAENIGKIKGFTAHTISITRVEDRKKQHYFLENEGLIMVVPTYAGKIPNKIMPYIKENILGNNSKAAAVVTYGNRSFDNSLAELVDILTENEFNIISAASFVCEHPFSRKLGKGRPDNIDMEILDEFTKKLSEFFAKKNINNSLLKKLPGDAKASYYTPKKEDGEMANFLKATPKTDGEKCIGCKVCVDVCPMNVVDEINVKQTNGPCIKCHACIKRCPAQARYFDDEDFLSHVRMLEKNFTERKEPTIYFPNEN